MSTETQKQGHTPGPWSTEENATLGRPAVYSASYRVAVMDAGNVGLAFVEAKANARLISAAPELLTAAKNTLDYYKALDPRQTCLYDELNPCKGNKAHSVEHWGGGPACPLCSARAAIALASGR